MRLLKRTLYFFRKIQVHIVTIFFLLISFSSLIIIFFNYHRNYEGIHDLSEEIIQQVSGGLIDKMNSVTRQTQLLAEATRGVIINREDPASNIPVLAPYLINMLKYSPMVFSVGVATVDGYYLAVIDMALAGLSHYYSDPQKALPRGVKYAVRIINNNTSPSTETWQYLGTDKQVLATDTINPSSYDPRTDPWFTRMNDWPSVQWANSVLPRGVNKYQSSEEPGITVSVPVYNRDNTFVAMIGTNITLNYLSNYITHQQIGKSGQAFILDSEGKLLIPIPSSLDPASLELAQTLIPSAYKQYEEDEKEHFFFREGKTEYIIHVQDFPISLDDEWIVVIAVPFSDFFARILTTQNATILISLTILIIFSILVFFFSKRISVPIVQLAREVDKITHFDFRGKFSVKSNIHEIKILDSSIAALRVALESFGKYVPKDVVKTLVEEHQMIELGGKKIVLPILFTDITDFTATSEGMTSEETMSSLSLYFDTLSKIILESQGTIDKYIGDSVMAFWGAPRAVSDPIKTACVTALRAHRACNLEAKARGLPEWKTRFGIHCGEVIVGNIGTSERMNYTVIGDAVNTASRLTAINKEYHTSIIISDAVHKSIGDGFVTRPLDFVAVKGKKIKLTIYELVGMKEGEFVPTPDQIQLCEDFTQAYVALLEGRQEEAKQKLIALSERFPDDIPTQMLLKRLYLNRP